MEARRQSGGIDRRAVLSLLAGGALAPIGERLTMAELTTAGGAPAVDSVTLFLAGDVMVGRGVDQALPHPGDPRLYEPAVRSARRYLELAEQAHGPIPHPVDFAYVWGDALAALREANPAARLVNLETSITRSLRPEPKTINYKMSPDNIGCLVAAGLDCCMLANNHTLDWGVVGLVETLASLDRAGIRHAGAGRDAAEAAAPATLDVGGGRRLLVFGFGSETSGVPPGWAAGAARPGVNLLDDLSAATLARIARQTASARRDGDLLIASLHWGPNWGYRIPDEFRAFAHGLVDEAGFDLVHGHSCHHAQGIELYREKLILYGCGDFLDDYEGISGYEEYRPDLVVMYLPTLSAGDGRLLALRLIPFRIRNFRLNRATPEEAQWLQRRLDRESARLGARVGLGADRTLAVTPR